MNDPAAADYGLTDRQLLFANEYLVDFNAAAAYERAGYQARGHARYTGASKLLANPKVQAYLAARRHAAVVQSGLTVERLTKELERICFSDPRLLFQENGALKNLSTLDEDVARTVSGIELGDKVKITMWDKLGAIEKALKLLNAYPDKKTDVPTQTIVGVVVVPPKGMFAPQERQAIEGAATREATRTPPLQAAAKTFKVLAAE